eukprot:365349-Amphidinium_carterae.1
MVSRTRGRRTGKLVTTFSELYHSKRIKLPGHLFRADPSDPMHHCMFDPLGNDLIQLYPKRVGRPRQTWFSFVAENVYGEFLHMIWPEQPDEALQALRELALLREPPYDCPPPLPFSSFGVS